MQGTRTRACAGSAVAAPRRSTHRAGFTLAETALAITILIVALMSISAATLRSHALRRQNQEMTLAHNALRSMSERVQAVASAASTTPATWAQTVSATFGPGGAIGPRFDIFGLTPVDTDASVGSIQIVVDETMADEDVGAALGMPRDLNGDGDATDADVTATARLLPVVVTVRWTGSRGELRLDHPFYVMGY